MSASPSSPLVARFTVGLAVLVFLLVALSATAGDARRRRPRPKPDLVERSVSHLPSATLNFGDAFTVRAQVRNAGHVKAPRSVTQFFLVGRPPPTLTPTGWSVGSQAIPALKPGRSYTRTAHLRIPTASDFDSGGGWHLIACADGPARVKESNEKNDCKLAAASITVKDRPVEPFPTQNGAPGLQGSGAFSFAPQPNYVRFQVTFNQSVDTITFWVPRDFSGVDFDGGIGNGCGTAANPNAQEGPVVLNGQTYTGTQCGLRSPLPPNTPATGTIGAMSPNPSAGMGGYLYGATDNGNSVSGPFTITGP